MGRCLEARLRCQASPRAQGHSDAGFLGTASSAPFGDQTEGAEEAAGTSPPPPPSLPGNEALSAVSGSGILVSGKQLCSGIILILSDT